MNVSVDVLRLQLAKPFRIAHGTSMTRENAIVYVGKSAGEAALPPYYGYTVDDIQAYVETVDFTLVEQAGAFAINRFLDQLPPGPLPAIAALDMAMHDWWAKELGQPLYAVFGHFQDNPILSTYALSIPYDEVEWLQTLSSVQNFPSLKLKLGSGNLDYDEAIVRIAREQYGGRLSVDANSAWSIPDAVKMISKLKMFELDYIEQPIGFQDTEDWHLLRRFIRRPGVPLIADESVQTAEDIIALAGAADGVNVKLAKCGGIRNTQKMITVARALDMHVMLGCMIESSLGLTAAAHLAHLADFVDIDGTLHLKDDPFTGLAFSNGYISLPARIGLGVEPASIQE